MVFFLASLPVDEYIIVKEIFNHFENCAIKDQKLSRNKRGSLINSKLDCKGVNFKPLRGLSQKTRKELLRKVSDCDISFSELASTCKYTKKMENVKAQFLRYLNIPSWEQAKEKYPEHTKKERLEPFLEMTFKNDTIPPLFIAFCKQAKCHNLSVTPDASLTSQPEGQNSSGSCTLSQTGKPSFVLLKQDVLHLEDKDLVSSSAAHSCNGFSLTIVDPPKARGHYLRKGGVLWLVTPTAEFQSGKLQMLVHRSHTVYGGK